MGIYLNPGMEMFEKAIRSEIYIDKTEMIHYLNTVLNTEQQYVSVSRPRRFGKTMAANMICAYYDRSIDSRPVFRKYRLSAARTASKAECGRKTLAWDVYLNRFDVIYLNMMDFLGAGETVRDMIGYLNEEVTEELREAYPDVRYGSRSDLRTVMSRIHAQTKRQFVIVIDEWDCVFREYTNAKFQDDQKAYLDFLRDLLKDKKYVALAYMTGILPIKKYGKHSALNMFREFSMTSPKQLAGYFGFTDEEVTELCKEHRINYDEIKRWYDGYLLSNKASVGLIDGSGETGEIQPQLYNDTGRSYHIYSPLSVVSAVTDRKLENYWNETETYEALETYINRNYGGLKEFVTILMRGERMGIDISNYQNDMTTFHSRDDILTLLIHLGYLGYDSAAREVFVPNEEIKAVFRSSTQGDEWDVLFGILNRSQKLLEATWEGDQETVAELIEAAHQRAGNQTYHSEAALSYAIRLAYFNAEQYYTLIPEMQAGKGYADLVYLPSPKHGDKPALLVELKYEKDADTAITQIYRQRYPDALEHYKGNMILVAINYDREQSNHKVGFKHHSCVIERA